MSDYYNENKLKLVVRKVQSGKTFILAEDIEKDKTDTIHIIFTMNTILSTNQLLVRLPTNNIIVCNSNSKYNKTDTFQYYHAKSCDEIMKCLYDHDIKCIVMCTNSNKFIKLIPELFNRLKRDYKLNTKKIKFHIDEAHSSINLIKNDNTVRMWYDNNNVSEIILYSATPLNLWDDHKIWKKDKTSIFYSIYVIDVEAERNIKDVSTYFGVKDLDCTNINKDSIEDIILRANLPCKIPDNVIYVFTKYSLKCKQSIRKHFNYNFYLDSDKLSSLLGSEYEYLCYIKIILPELIVNKDIFSYTFIPGYTRCITHYMICELILDIYPDSNIIVINGQFIGLYDNANNIIEYTDDLNNGIELYEPSQKIECLIRGRRNKPTFVTGFMCVNMSVTLISESIGNFDNVVICHSHCPNDMVYQICRFAFNYINWNEHSVFKIKKTRFFSINDKTIQIAQEYEETIEKINSASGKSITFNDINGISENNNCSKTDDIRNIKIQLFNNLKEVNIITEFKVYSNNEITETEMWERVKRLYFKKKGKECLLKSIPTKRDGFYICGISKKKEIMNKTDIKNQIETWCNPNNWDNNYILNNSRVYVRIYVGYDNINNPTEYSIFVRHCVLNECDEVFNLLQQHADLKHTQDIALNNPLYNGSSEILQNNINYLDGIVNDHTDILLTRNTNVNSGRTLNDNQEFTYTSSKSKVVTKFVYNALENAFKIKDDNTYYTTLSSVITSIEGSPYRQNAWVHCKYKVENKWLNTKNIKINK